MGALFLVAGATLPYLLGTIDNSHMSLKNVLMDAVIPFFFFNLIRVPGNSTKYDHMVDFALLAALFAVILNNPTTAHSWMLGIVAFAAFVELLCTVWKIWKEGK